jgi:ABC-type dipeptide/oligopeptide/nickel transport system permease component
MIHVQRGVMMLAVIWLAATLAFIALRIIPGDAITSQLAQSGVSEDAIQERRAEQGLDAPIVVQYGRYLRGLIHGDFGNSLLSGQPVAQMIAQQFAPTVMLAGAALVFATILGIGLGCVSALDMGLGTTIAARVLVNLSLSMPLYWTGTVAIYIFSVWLGLLPSAGGARLSQLVLPVAVLGFHTSGAIARVTHANLREVRSAEFVRAAHAKGLPARSIALRHILRVGLIPVVTVIALQAGFLLGGTVITESLFVRPGIGRLLLEATLQQDYPVVQGIVILAALGYALINTSADLLYRLLDPRVA